MSTLSKPVVCLDLTRTFASGDGLHAFTLSIDEGALHAVVGPNGSGKSTLLRLLTGLLRPESGEARVFGERADRADGAALRHVGALVDFPAFYTSVSALENLRYIADLRGLPRSRVEMALDAVQLRRPRHQLVRDYSMGMKQRLGLAAALLGEPRLLILDEPTSSVDPTGVEDIEALLCAWRERHGTTVLFTSHSFDQVERLATHVSILASGTLLGSFGAHDGAALPTTVLLDVPADCAVEDLAAQIGIDVDCVVRTPYGLQLQGLELGPDDAGRLQAELVTRGIRILDWRRGMSAWRRALRLQMGRQAADGREGLS
ncbi:ATP-binding cassette domain-containing protein [Gemmatimonas aurantiaca]|uniref:ABC transporter ATP-binding protein n=1 Tax=Gemmatimonas aurantiaca TaxID=173480 RepID=UPI00301DBA7A